MVKTLALFVAGLIVLIPVLVGMVGPDQPTIGFIVGTIWGVTTAKISIDRGWF